MNKPYLKTINDIFKELDTSEKGLNLNEINYRIKKYGKNILSEEKRPGAIKRFFLALKDIMLIILIFSGLVSIALGVVNKINGDIFEGVLILVIVFVNALISVIQEGKAENALDELKKNTQSHIFVRRNNSVIKVPVSEITLGDVVILSSGDIVPCDIRLFYSKDLKTDESSLSGETDSVLKDENAIISDNSVLSSHLNMCYGGTVVVSGKGEGIAVNIGIESQIGKISSHIENTQKELSPLQKSLNKLNQTISVVILIICAIVYIFEVFKGKNGFLNAFLTAITLAVAAVPESLPAVTSIIMAIGVKKLSEKKAIVKKLPIVETLGSCQIICSDKTGTLTQNKMVVDSIYLPCRNAIFISYENSADFDKLVCGMLLCNNSIITNGNIIGESTEKALADFGLKSGFDYESMQKNYPMVDEIGFTSERKMMSKVVKDKFLTIYTKGSIENVLKKCTFIQINGVVQKLTDDHKKEILLKNKMLCDKALRVLAFAYKELYYYDKNIDNENNMIFNGLVGMFDPPREEVKKAIEDCISAHLVPIMITGDHKDTALSIARMLGIASKSEEVISGEELNKISDSLLEENLEKFKVFARVNPEHKVRIVNAFQKKNKIVAMTGDGINDAPALKKANIGISVGDGTEVAKNASDMIITDNNFSTIVTAIKEGREIFQNIQKTVQFLFSTNIVEVVTIFLTSLFFPSFTFLLPSQLLFINLVTDGLPAFALGLEKDEKNIMKTPPRKNTSSVFEKQNIIDMSVQAIFQIAVIMALYILSAKHFDNLTASTMCFFTFSIMQINHSVNMKTYSSIFKINLFDNFYFNLSYIVCFGLNFVIYFVPVFNTMFGLSHLDLTKWIIVFVCSFSIIPFVEIQKIISSKMFRKDKI